MKKRQIGIIIFLLLVIGLLVISSCAPTSRRSHTNSNCTGNCYSGWGTYFYSNGLKYVGEWKNGKWHGQGTMTYSDGQKYVGEWKNGQRYTGSTSYANSQKYVGTLNYTDGGKYVGEIKNNKRHGQGTYTFPDGRKYVGESKDNKWHGQGTFTWPNGRNYVGEWRDEKYNGQGIESWSDGTRYVGHFKNDQKHGQGTMTFPNGTYLKGQWKNGLLSGQGTQTWANGKKYVGQWQNGQRTGQGTTTINGLKYVGGFRYGSWNGYGTLVLPNGNKYTGNFKNDKYNGQGTFTFANGERYVGKWQNSKKNGQGILYSSNGSVMQQGMWKDDVYVIASNQPEPKKKNIATPSNINFGTYHAIVIGNNNYQYLSKLKTAVQDAESVAKLLKGKYNFKVNLLANATRLDILKALNNARRNLSENDNLLIYYAGHGWLDKDVNRGYWIPVDAEEDSNINWISNVSITDAVKGMSAKHVMLVADSCYSGKLTRGLKLSIRKKNFLSRLSKKKARTVLTSGGLEPVMDSGGGKHSVFAKAFINALEENDSVLDGHKLLSIIRRPVMLDSDQTPEYSDIRKAGHGGGDFLFVRKN